MEPLDQELEEGPAFVLRERHVKTAGGDATISYLVCEPLEEIGFTNAFSTRLGGVSPFPVNSLNLAASPGDDDANVEENRNRFLEAIGATGRPIATLKQVHSNDRTVIDSISRGAADPTQADAMTSTLDDVMLGIQTADCVPLLIGDPTTGAMAAIHAGWRGTAGRITERTIADLMQLHGVSPQDCIAAIGPAACADCYEIGPDVVDVYRKQFGYWRKVVRKLEANGRAHLDVVGANYQQLAFCGFSPDRIYVAPYCTMHQNELFFSYRREAGGKAGVVGRLLSVIGRLTA